MSLIYLINPGMAYSSCKREEIEFASYTIYVNLPITTSFYYIDTDEIPGFFLLLKYHIFIMHSEDTIFIFHV